MNGIVFKRHLFSILLLLSFVLLLCYKLNAQKLVSSTDSLSSTKKKIYFTIRLGQGGFTDDRSPIGKLGGGQLALDIKPRTFPIAISISNEYYTNSADPTHSYEIAGLIAINFLYKKKLIKTERLNFFAGGGAGVLEVPKGEDEHDATERGILYNIEGGINFIVFWKIGCYGIYKYLYAKKEIKNEKVIDFNEHIVLLGITFNFSL
jgi:hypothetical protein